MITKDIQAILQSASTNSTAFQSIVITSLQTIATILEKEKRASKEALSLGQQVKMHRMITRLEDLQLLLKGVLNKQGQMLLNLQVSFKSDALDSFGGSWWACVDELVETIEHGIDCIGSIIKSQPEKSLARTLGLAIIEILSGQHEELLVETGEQLIGH